MNLDPGVLGWSELWLRLGAIAFFAFSVLLTLAVALKVVEAVVSPLLWLYGKTRRRVTVTGGRAGEIRATLLSLVSCERMDEAQRLLDELSCGPVYVAEYEGQMPRVFLAADRAREECTRLMANEPAVSGRAWDWISDSDGWALWFVDPDTGRAIRPAQGRVTRAEIEH